MIVMHRMPWNSPLTQAPRVARVWRSAAGAFTETHVPLSFEEWFVYHLSVAHERQAFADDAQPAAQPSAQ